MYIIIITKIVFYKSTNDRQTIYIFPITLLNTFWFMIFILIYTYYIYVHCTYYDHNYISLLLFYVAMCNRVLISNTIFYSLPSRNIMRNTKKIQCLKIWALYINIKCSTKAYNDFLGFLQYSAAQRLFIIYIECSTKVSISA